MFRRHSSDCRSQKKLQKVVAISSPFDMIVPIRPGARFGPKGLREHSSAPSFICLLEYIGSIYP
jgi:arginase family enzyme